jgi:hypothetical protein
MNTLCRAPGWEPTMAPYVVAFRYALGQQHSHHHAPLGLFATPYTTTHAWSLEQDRVVFERWQFHMSCCIDGGLGKAQLGLLQLPALPRLHSNCISKCGWCMNSQCISLLQM